MKSSKIDYIQYLPEDEKIKKDVCMMSNNESITNNSGTEVKFMTVDEFAKRIGVHPQTVRSWDKSGALRPHHKTPSGRRLYSEEQVIDFFGKK